MTPEEVHARREKERVRKAKWRLTRSAEQINNDRERARLSMLRRRNKQLINDIVNEIVQTVLKK